MEQMEQLLPLQTAQDHLRNSCKSDEILEVRVGVAACVVKPVATITDSQLTVCCCVSHLRES